MRHTSEREIRAVLLLDSSKRFSHFVKRVADEERAWGLWNSGWALMATEDGRQVFPLWPASEYAELHRLGPLCQRRVRQLPPRNLCSKGGEWT